MSTQRIFPIHTMDVLETCIFHSKSVWNPIKSLLLIGIPADLCVIEWMWQRERFLRASVQTAGCFSELWSPFQLFRPSLKDKHLDMPFCHRRDDLIIWNSSRSCKFTLETWNRSGTLDKSCMGNLLSLNRPNQSSWLLIGLIKCFGSMFDQSDGAFGS